MLGNLGPVHLLILVLIIVLIFGAKRLPSVASSVGQSLKVFKKEVHELRDDDYSSENQPGTDAPQVRTEQTPDSSQNTASTPPKTS